MKKRRLAALFMAMMVFLGGLEVFATEAPEATEVSEEATVIEEVVAPEVEEAEDTEDEPSEEKVKKEKAEKIKEEKIKPEKSKKTEEAEEETEETEEAEESGEKKEPSEEKEPEGEKERKITKEEIEAKKEERKAKRTEAKAFIKELKNDFGKADEEAKKAILSEIAALKKELKDYSIGVFVRGADIDFEKYDGVAPEIENGRTLIPLRAIAEALEAEVLWNEAERKVTITKGGTETVLIIGEKTAYVNGVEVELEAAPRIRKDRTLVPLRFLAEAFEEEISWDEESKTVVIE